MIVSENFSNVKLWPLFAIILALTIGYLIGKSNHLEETKVSKLAAVPDKDSVSKPDKDSAAEPEITEK